MDKSDPVQWHLQLLEETTVMLLYLGGAPHRGKAAPLLLGSALACLDQGLSQSPVTVNRHGALNKGVVSAFLLQQGQ